MLNRRPIPFRSIAGLAAAQNVLMAVALMLSPQPLWLSSLLLTGSLGASALLLWLLLRRTDTEIADAPQVKAEDSPELLPPQSVEILAEDCRLEDMKLEIDSLRQVLAALDSSMRQLGSGHFSTRLDAPFPEAYEGLRGDFNSTAARLQQTLQDLTGATAKLHAASADLHAQSDLVRSGCAENAAVVDRLAGEAKHFFEGLRSRDAEIGHLAAVAHNAALDGRRTREASNAPMNGMRSLSATTAQMGPVAERMIALALETNMATMNLHLRRSVTGEDGAQLDGAAEEIRRLAAETAEAAKEMAQLARTTRQAAAPAEHAFGQMERELGAVGLYLEAIHEKTQQLAANTTEQRKGAAGLRVAVMTLAKTGREEIVRAEHLSDRAADLARQVTALDRQLGPYVPVTVIQPGSVFKPQPAPLGQTPRRPPHLRLV